MAPVEFNVVDGKGIADYVFEVAGRERIKVPAGEFDAMRLAQRKETSRATAAARSGSTRRAVLSAVARAGGAEGRHAHRPGRHARHAPVIVYRAQLARAEALLAELLSTSGPADAAVSRYFRAHRNLGQQDRAFVAETVYAVLRRRRSLEAAAQSARRATWRSPRWCACAGFRGARWRVLLREGEEALVSRVRAAKAEAFPAGGARRPARLAVAAARGAARRRTRRCAWRRACSIRRRSTCASTSQS